VSAPIALGITTANSVAAAVIAGDVERSAATSDQALAGTLPVVSAALKSAGASIDAIDLIAVCTGPGSFTGLRIGVAFAKSVAQALDVPIVGVSAYDVAEWGEQTGSFPRTSIVPGKRDYYYIRVRRDPQANAEFIRGTREQVEPALAQTAQFWLTAVSPEEAALRVARIGCRLAAGGAIGDWRTLAIDYGQRPNAVVNWETRRGVGERGGAPSAANPTER
jgi:tRNA threonylcarbamoyl adenosine modification protein YeaZ